MMRLIDADMLKALMIKTLEKLKKDPCYDGLQTVHMVCAFDTVGKMVDDAPTVDAVPVKSIEQVKWERDTAVQQLEEHGIPFCGKSDVVSVVRCEECKEWAKTIGDEGFSIGRCELLGRDLVMNKGFCAWGVRKDDAH